LTDFLLHQIQQQLIGVILLYLRELEAQGCPAIHQQLMVFCSGGYTPTSDIIDKFPFASAGNAVDHGDLTEWTTRAAGTMSTTYGYTAAGKTAPAEYSNKIDKFAFSSNTTATDHGDVSVARNQVAGCTSHDYGFTCGGYNPSYNVIDKFAFSSNTTATDHGDLVIVNAGPFAGCQSETHGFVTGGVSYGNMMDKFAFSSNVTATDHGNLTLGRMKHACSSSNTHGFSMGGEWQASDRTNVIDKFAFASTGNATDHGDLTIARDYLVGQQV